MKTLAIDIGYGETKVAVDQKSFSYRSGFAPFRESDVDVGTAYGIKIAVQSPQDQPYRDIGTYIVGDKSVLYPGYTEPVGNERLGTEEGLVLLAEAIFRADLNGDIVVSTGAPLDLYGKEKKNAAKWEGLKLVVTGTNGRQCAVTIAKVITRPQGVAAAIALTSLNMLPSESGIGVVVDIGSRTTDVVSLALSPKDVDPIRPLCFSIPVGVGDFMNFVGEGLSKAFGGFRPKRSLVQNALGQAVFTYGGKSCEMAPIVDRARNAVVTSLSNEIRRRFGEQGEFVVVAAAVGGGSLPDLLGPVVGRLFEGVPLVTVSAEDSIFMNAAGYLIVAKNIVHSL